MSKKAWFISFLIIWLLALPLAFTSGYVARNISEVPASTQGPKGNDSLLAGTTLAPQQATEIAPMARAFNVVSIIGNMYFVLGWIPVIVFGLQSSAGAKVKP